MVTLGHKLIDLLVVIGESLGFHAQKEVGASESAYVDVAWFDQRLSFRSLGIKRQRQTRYWPVLPIVAFEVEVSTGMNAKHVKGSISNLDNLGALVGVLVIGSGNISQLGKRSPHIGKPETDLEKLLMGRVYRWAYTESRPHNRIIIMTEKQVLEMAKHLKIPIPNTKSPM